MSSLPNTAAALEELIATWRERQAKFEQDARTSEHPFRRESEAAALWTRTCADELEALAARLRGAEKECPGFKPDETAIAFCKYCGETRAGHGLRGAQPADSGWLVELGCNPPQWWTGRGDEFTPWVDGKPNARGNDADHAIRFARREDAERAISWLVKEGVKAGCKATEHLWLLNAAAALPKGLEPQPERFVNPLPPPSPRAHAQWCPFKTSGGSSSCDCGADVAN